MTIKTETREGHLPWPESRGVRQMSNPRTHILPEEYLRFLLVQECQRAERYSHFFSIVSIQLQTPELENLPVLAVADLIRGVIRSSDIVGSFQDRRLVVILHHAEDQNADDITARIREKIQYSLRRNPEKGSIRIGGACFPSHASTVQDLLSVAEGR